MMRFTPGTDKRKASNTHTNTLGSSIARNAQLVCMQCRQTRTQTHPRTHHLTAHLETVNGDLSNVCIDIEAQQVHECLFVHVCMWCVCVCVKLIEAATQRSITNSLPGWVRNNGDAHLLHKDQGLCMLVS